MSFLVTSLGCGTASGAVSLIIELQVVCDAIVLV